MKIQTLTKNQNVFVANNMKTLIWEFYGFDAEETSHHHTLRLNEFMKSKNYNNFELSFKKIDDYSAIACMKLLKEDDFENIAKILKPKKIEFS